MRAGAPARRSGAEAGKAEAREASSIATVRGAYDLVSLYHARGAWPVSRFATGNKFELRCIFSQMVYFRKPKINSDKKLRAYVIGLAIVL